MQDVRTLRDNGAKAQKSIPVKSEVSDLAARQRLR
jgi:hypothetical protein